MTTKKLTKLLALYLPYILLGLVATNFGEAWRLAEGKELGDKIMSMMGTVPVAFANPLPSLHPIDLLVGLCCGAGLRLAVYLRGKNAKKGKILVPHRASRRTDLVEIEAGLLRIHVQAGVLDAHVRDTHLHLDSLALVRIVIEPYADIVSAHLTGITGI